MLDDALKLVAALVTAVAGALCAAFIPLLRRTYRAQQDVELGLKEVERIEKTLKIAAALKADYGVEIDVSEVPARLRFVIANMVSDEKKSDVAIQEYLSTTPTFWSGIKTPLPRIRSPRRLSLIIRFLKIFPLFGIFVLWTEVTIFTFIDPNKMSKMFGILGEDLPQQIILFGGFLIFNYVNSIFFVGYLAVRASISICAATPSYFPPTLRRQPGGWNSASASPQNFDLFTGQCPAGSGPAPADASESHICVF